MFSRWGAAVVVFALTGAAMAGGRAGAWTKFSSAAVRAAVTGDPICIIFQNNAVTRSGST